MTEFNFDFEQVQQAPEAHQFRPCCYGPVQMLLDLAKAIREGPVDPKAVEQNVWDATQKLPAAVTEGDAAELQAAFGGVIAALGAKAEYAGVQRVVAVSERIVDLHIRAAQAGAHPTTQQIAELGEAATRVNLLMKELSGSSIPPSLHAEVQVRTEVFVKQAQEANPFFGVSIASVPASEVKPQPAEPAAKGLGYESTRETAVERRPSIEQESSKGMELSSKERARESAKETVSDAPKVARAEVKAAEQLKASNEPHTQRVGILEGRQSSPAGAAVTATVERAASPAAPSAAVLPPAASSPATSSSPPPSPVAWSSAAPSPAAVSQQAYVSPAAVTARNVSAAPYAPASSATQSSSVRPSSVSVAPSVARIGGGASATQVERSPERGVATRTVQRVASAAVVSARRSFAARSTATTSSNRSAERRAQGVRPAGEKTLGERLARSGTLRSRDTRPEGTPRLGRERGVIGVPANGRVVVNGRTVIASPVQRVATLLAQLRALSPKQLKDIRHDRYARPKEVQVALAIRARAQRIIERIKVLPLKDIVKLKALRAEAMAGKGGREKTALSAQEMLARREVRLLIRDLSARLQSFLNPRSMLYNRVMTELTLSDLERLVSLLGGNRAVKGLRKKLKAGEVTQVFEADISNSFLSQLASAANGSSGVSDSGGSDEPSTSPEGAGAEVSAEASTEETTVVADGAVPTATLSTFIMKEEAVANRGMRGLD